MIKNVLNKKVEIAVALASVKPGIPDALCTKLYEGIIVNFDDNFILLDDDSLINIKYIQYIKII